ncbi:MAG TPA: hypothetical protein VNT26_24025 [Candidatus Sulfotelmatobacter sp.]|nr:hypothetical protein [Candidatus Sulfotelmatobacter sp.]HWI59612.1 hypothetical protein [Bacillota bacterium]
MKRLVAQLRWMVLLLGVLAACGLSGCATTDETENASVRPWNAPKGWETGIPSTMTEGR